MDSLSRAETSGALVAALKLSGVPGPLSLPFSTTSLSSLALFVLVGFVLGEEAGEAEGGGGLGC